ncbi:AraC family transcriptional regulator [Gellertiella hungarica]|uniref:AraC-like DNA-binding protein/mannose-6-phosphate isomerase-like protein (Cupin superfamily) n=1 Tax=Gellertiella hungarica TaxID=1572859 RepID=A0A7W6NMQ0_9HYPH|nr:helix-turn-helix transcriptional regulator [Gellertiella hungarica]MBB4066592.1 AraC-like DNA-binding protein/mannose-6-phosphate isomerase-like protein (cupin superfamily) [Gellertiella hungarica]
MRNLDFIKNDHATADEQHFRSLRWIEGANEPVVALGRLYPAGLRVPEHQHSRTQLWFARRGVVLVTTATGRWMIPPGHALVIPARLDHATEMVSDVEMHSIYVDAGAEGAKGPRVVEVTMLARSLIEELVRVEEKPLSERRQLLVMELLLDELACLPERPLGLPFPSEARLAALCRAFLKAPSASASIDGWAQALGMSRRSFTRHFRQETGVSFVTWRQQACIFASLPRLADGQAVTSVALDAGYENISAFTTMFRRMLGSSPSSYLRARGG